MGASVGWRGSYPAVEYDWRRYIPTWDPTQATSAGHTYGWGRSCRGGLPVGPEVVRLVLPAEFHEAARIVPWIGLGVAFHGVYLLTSIGLNITRQTRYYPLATAAAATTSIAANIVLVPRFGIIGAAWANATAYGVLAATALVLSQRVYPIALEWGRLARIVVAGAGALAAALALPPMEPLAAGLLRGVTVCAVLPALLARSASSTRASAHAAGSSNGPPRTRPADRARGTGDSTVPDAALITTRSRCHDPPWTPGRLAILMALWVLAECSRHASLRPAGGLQPGRSAIMSRALASPRATSTAQLPLSDLLFYVLFACVGGWFAASWVVGAVPSLAASRPSSSSIRPRLPGRGARSLVVCGVATVWLVGCSAPASPGGGPARPPRLHGGRAGPVRDAPTSSTTSR